MTGATSEERGEQLEAGGGAVSRRQLTAVGLEASVLSAGAASPPLLLLHGWGGDATTWDHVIAGLAAERRVVAPDFAGFGASSPPPGDWSVSDFVDWTLALLDALGLDRPDVVGRSFGGRVAIKLAAGHPDRVRRLVLLNSAGIPPQRDLRYRLRVAVAKVGKAALSTPLTRRWSERARDRAYRGRAQESATSQATIGTFKLVVAEDLSADLTRVRAPTLVIAGSADTVVPLADATRMAALVPGATLRVVDGASHQTHLDAPDTFLRLVRDHLAGA